jgi:UDPglucose 6-dehydrogenase/GDP-mannose 6-dehydrogenase
VKIAIVGTGYVGLVTGTCLADRGHEVACIDSDLAKIDAINSGIAPIHEEGLEELLRRNLGQRLRATSNLQQAVRNADVTFIAVGTPATDGRIDLKFVMKAAEEVGEALRGSTHRPMVVVKSTVVPGTTSGPVQAVVERASGLTAGVTVDVGMNPEFLTEGTAVNDFMNPDRLVLGSLSVHARQQLDCVYESFDPAVPRVHTNPSTAEMIKYAANAVLATMISFSNEIARICSAHPDIDALDVMRGVHESGYFTLRLDSRRIHAPITAFLEGGCGFGGSCLPKDVTALNAHASSLGIALPLLGSVLQVNAGQANEMIRLLKRHFPLLDGVRVTVLGIAFKPDTDDVRESPAFPIIEQLLSEGAKVTVFDPIARVPPGTVFADMEAAPSLQAAVAAADAILLVTRWSQFRDVPALIRMRPDPPLVVDGRRMLDKHDCARYEGIGL